MKNRATFKIRLWSGIREEVYLMSPFLLSPCCLVVVSVFFLTLLPLFVLFQNMIVELCLMLVYTIFIYENVSTPAQRSASVLPEK